jgi:hypothetical protein
VFDAQAWILTLPYGPSYEPVLDSPVKLGPCPSFLPPPANPPALALAVGFIPCARSPARSCWMLPCWSRTTGVSFYRTSLLLDAGSALGTPASCMHASCQSSVADFVNDIGSFHDNHYGNYAAFRNTTSLHILAVSTSVFHIDFTDQYGRGSCRRRTGGVRIQAPASKGHDRKSRSFLSKLLPLSQLPYPSPWFTPICVSLVRAATRSLHVHSFELCTI